MDHDLPLSYSSIWLTTSIVGLSLIVGVGFRPSGLRTWLGALLWHAAGWGLLAAGPWHEPSRWLTGALGAAAVTTGTGHMLLTARHYLGRALPRLAIVGPPLLAGAVYLATVGRESIQMALVSVVMAGQLAALSWLLLPRRRADRAARWRWLAGGGYSLATILVAIPTLAYLVLPASAWPEGGASWGSIFGTVVANGWTAIALVCTLAFLLAHRDEAEQALHRLATRDDLTGLLNRRAFLEAGQRALAEQQAAGAPITLAIFDLDHFKRINDSRGHAAGDAVIALFAQVLADCVGAGDLADRHGGEEFCVLLHGDLAGARHLDRRLRGCLAPEADARLGFRFDFSGGAACSARDDLSILIARADRALYAAKRAGRGCLSVNDAELDGPTASTVPAASMLTQAAGAPGAVDAVPR